MTDNMAMLNESVAKQPIVEETEESRMRWAAIALPLVRRVFCEIENERRQLKFSFMNTNETIRTSKFERYCRAQAVV